MGDIKVKALFVTSRRIHPQLDNVSFGKYTIEPIPSVNTGNTNATNQYLLRFHDEIDENEGRSNPHREVKQVLSLVSLWLGTRLEIKSLMLNNVNVGTRPEDAAVSGVTGVIVDLPPLRLLTREFNSFDLDIARQFLRAADVYKTAVNLIGQNNTLSYFLLTVAIECLSNKVKAEPNKGTCDSFVDFILTYLPDKSQIDSDQEWEGLLKEIYYRHRSGFTHGGKEIPEASAVADMLNRIYIKHVVEGKEIKTPSLRWFESVVRKTLVGFLLAHDKGDANPEDTIKEISLEHGILKLVSKKNIEAGSVVTEGDLDLD